MSIGYSEIVILAFAIAMCCYLPGIIGTWHRAGRIIIGSLSLIVMLCSLLACGFWEIRRKFAF